MANRAALLRAVREGDRDESVRLTRSSVRAGLAAQKHDKIRKWLAANLRLVVYLIPTHVPRMNLVDVWFSVIERQAIHRGSFASVKELNAKLRAFIDGWNDRCHPFVWTKPADQILRKANSRKTLNAGHMDRLG